HQVKHIAIPKQFTQAMRDIWLLQLRLPHRNGIKPYRLLTHPRFRAAYDFLLLRSEAGEVEPKLAQWWTEFQCADEAKKKQMSKTTANRHQRTGNTKDKNKF
ncbi:MAG: Poly(A) polymerase, partial [Pseudomonadota bacterium]